MTFKTPTRVQADQMLAARKERMGANDSNFLEDFGSGLVEGIQEDPFVALALKGLSAIDGADPNGLEEIRRRTRGSTAAQAGRFIGEWGPTLLFGLATYGGGFLAGRAAIQGVAKKVALQDAVRTSLHGVGRAVTRSELSGGLKPTGGFVRKSLDQTARKAGDRAGVAAEIQGTPWIQAGAERTGAATGIGSATTSQELARGKSPREALKTGALAAALTLGIDTALVGGSRALFRSSRVVDLAALRERFVKSGGVKKFQSIADKEATKVKEINTKLRKVLKTDDQQMELELGLPTRAERSAEILKTPEVQDLVRTMRASKARQAMAKDVAANEGLSPYVADTPGGYLLSPGRLITDTPLAKLFAAPEALAGTQGVGANKYLSMLKKMLVRSEGEERTAGEVWSGWSNSVRRAAGVTGPKNLGKWKRGTGRNLDLAHAWEKVGGGPKAVKEQMAAWGRTNKQAEEVISIFEAREAREWHLYQVKGKKIGGKAALDLEKAKVGRYLPHGSHDWTERDLVKYMQANSKLTDTEIHKLIRARSSHMDPEMMDFKGVRTNQPSRNGPLDFDRVETGTTRDKITRGMPLNPNVWDAGFQAERSALRRINTDPILGGAVNTEKGRILGGTVDDMVALVEAEGGNGVQFRSIVDSLAGHTYYNESMRAWATAFTSIETAMKLPMAVLANATQPVLTATWLGYRNAIKGALGVTKKATRENIAQATAVHEHIGRAIGRSANDEGLALTGLELVADWVLRFTGFSSVERFNRIHGAASTQAMIRDRLARGAVDRLRGVRLDSARKMFGDVGLDFDGLVRELRAAKGAEEAFFRNPAFLELETNAMLQGAQKTQFFPGATRTPPLWGHPLARTILQFKTFATGQSRLMRDAVLTEYSHGNMAPLATYLSAAPIAGEMVGDARAFIKGKDRGTNGIHRALQNMSYIGGLGIVTDFWSLAQWGKTESFLMGPAISDLTQATELSMTGEWTGLRKMFQKQPAYQLTGFLMGTIAEGGGTMLEYLDSADSEDSGSSARVDIGQHLTERIQQKRR